MFIQPFSKGTYMQAESHDETPLFLWHNQGAHMSFARRGGSFSSTVAVPFLEKPFKVSLELYPEVLSMLSHVRVQKLTDMETGYLVNKVNALSLEHEKPRNINSDIEFNPQALPQTPIPWHRHQTQSPTSTF